MARKGRDLEILVEMLESIELPENASIISPGFINDKITGQSREVDILIEYKLGTVPIKIIVECRDRKSSQDTTWIEQLHTKVQDVGANKVIAVSSEKFTKPAITKAEHYNIETRTLTEINQDLVSSWWQVQHINQLNNRFQIIHASFFTDEVDIPENCMEGNGSTSKFISHEKLSEKLCLNEIFKNIAPNLPFWPQIAHENEPVVKHVKTNYSNPDDRYYIEFEDTKFIITAIEYKVKLWIEVLKIPINKISRYSGSDETISDVIEFNILDSNVENIQVVRKQDGSTQMIVNNKKK